jgi:broad specificity phosphatase PhoE
LYRLYDHLKRAPLENERVLRGGYHLATKIYLVRHGETQWNKDGRVQGQLDIGLSDEGLRQARCLARRLAAVEIDAIYSSDLSRAYKTAEIIAESKGLIVRAMPAFREKHFGEWQGMLSKEIDEKFPEIREQIRIEPRTTRVPGGECWDELTARVMAGLMDIAGSWTEGTIVVTPHGGTVRAALCEILGMDVRNRWKIRTDNTSISILEYRNSEWAIRCINDTAHLDSPFR